MARHHKITLVAATAAANSDPVMMNWRANQTNISLDFDTNGSTTSWTVQMTLDDPLTTAAASWRWINHSDLASMTADKVGNIAFPVTAIRLACNASGTDTGVLRILQAGG